MRVEKGDYVRPTCSRDSALWHLRPAVLLHLDTRAGVAPRGGRGRHGPEVLSLERSRRMKPRNHAPQRNHAPLGGRKRNQYAEALGEGTHDFCNETLAGCAPGRARTAPWPKPPSICTDGSWTLPEHGCCIRQRIPRMRSAPRLQVVRGDRAPLLRANPPAHWVPPMACP